MNYVNGTFFKKPHRWWKDNQIAYKSDYTVWNKSQLIFLDAEIFVKNGGNVFYGFHVGGPLGIWNKEKKNESQ